MTGVASIEHAVVRDVAARVVYARQVRELTLAEVARRGGISSAHLRGIGQGRNAASLAALARVGLGLDVQLPGCSSAATC